MAAGDRRHADFMSVGEEVGTGAAIVVKLNFKPIHVTIYNRTRNTQAVWTSVMPQDSAQLTIDSGAGTTDLSFVTTNAITGNPAGFTIGSNASINTASDIIYWVAERDSQVY